MLADTKVKVIVERMRGKGGGGSFGYGRFWVGLWSELVFVHRLLRWRLVIPDFKGLERDVLVLYEQCKGN